MSGPAEIITMLCQVASAVQIKWAEWLTWDDRNVIHLFNPKETQWHPGRLEPDHLHGNRTTTDGLGAGKIHDGLKIGRQIKVNLSAITITTWPLSRWSTSVFLPSSNVRVTNQRESRKHCASATWKVSICQTKAPQAPENNTR